MALAAGGAASAFGDDARRPSARRPAVKLKAGEDVVLPFWDPPPMYKTWRGWMTRPADGPEPRARGTFSKVFQPDGWIFPNREDEVWSCAVRGLRPHTLYSLHSKRWTSDYGFLAPSAWVDAGPVTIHFTTDGRGAGRVRFVWAVSDGSDFQVPQIEVDGNPFEIREPSGRGVLHGLLGAFDPNGRINSSVHDVDSGVDVVARMSRIPAHAVERLVVDGRRLPGRAVVDLFIAGADGTPAFAATATTSRRGRGRIVVDAKGSAPLPFGEPDVSRYAGRAYELRVDGRAVAAGTLPAFGGSSESTYSSYLNN
jgi:hypothetical protein